MPLLFQAQKHTIIVRVFVCVFRNRIRARTHTIIHATPVYQKGTNKHALTYGGGVMLIERRTLRRRRESLSSVYISGSNASQRINEKNVQNNLC